MVELGGEYGTVTGRRRRCGWIDLVALRYAARINGLTGLFLTKLDILSHFDSIRVAVAYTSLGERYEEFPDNSGSVQLRARLRGPPRLVERHQRRAHL